MDYIPAPVVPEILRAKIKVFVELYRMRQQVARQAEERARRLAAEESAQRSAFLARASGALSSSLDSEALLARLAGLAVPFLADLAIVCPEEEGDRPGRSQWAWTLPGQEAIAQSEGRTLLTLDTWTGRGAERLYLSLGYVAAGVIPRYARGSLTPDLEATTIMYKELASAG